MTFPKYPAYKDSGVEWLGEVPEHWNVAPVSRHYQIRNGFPFAAERFSPEGAPEHRLVRIRDILGNNSPIYTDEVCPPQCAVDNGDVLIGMDGDFNISYWMDGRAKLNQRVCAVRGKNSAWDRFFFYGISAPLKLINDLTFATTVKHLASSQILKARFPVPPENEVEQIARFLNHETARIDALIEEQQRLIELLKEKRQAVISHAVTKGLDPTVPMKDSGVEWLGEVPAHWKLLSIKHLALLNPKKSGFTGDREQLCSFVPMEKLKTGVVQLDEERLIEDVIDGYTYFEEGDVLQAKVTPCFENKNVAIAKELTNGIGFGSSEINVLRPLQGINAGYLYYRVQEDNYMDFCASSMIGAGGLKRVPTDVINNFKVAAPEFVEQAQITSFLDHETASIDALIEEANTGVGLLQERRTALISAAVTGKIDVRNWQPPAEQYPVGDTQNRTELEAV